ncbi:MAG: hypothetical protein ACTTJD_06735 [Porphyromonadaceae bacterium]
MATTNATKAIAMNMRFTPLPDLRRFMCGVFPVNAERKSATP